MYAQSVKISQLLSELTILTKSHELALQRQNATLLELVKTKASQSELPFNLPKHIQSIVEYSLNNPAEIILLATLTSLGCYLVYTTFVPVLLKTFEKGLVSIFFYQTIGKTTPGDIVGLPKHDHASIDIDDITPFSSDNI